MDEAVLLLPFLTLRAEAILLLPVMRLLAYVVVLRRGTIGAALQILHRADDRLHLGRQRRAASGELDVLRGEEIHRQVQADGSHRNTALHIRLERAGNV